MEYNLKAVLFPVFTVDAYVGSHLPEFTSAGVFLWIIYQRTDEETFIKTPFKDVSSISEISFCLN